MHGIGLLKIRYLDNDVFPEILSKEKDTLFFDKEYKNISEILYLYGTSYICVYIHVYTRIYTHSTNI